MSYVNVALKILAVLVGLALVVLAVAKIFGFGLMLVECSFRLGQVAFDPAAGKYRNTHPGLESESAVTRIAALNNTGQVNLCHIAGCLSHRRC